MLVLSRKLNQSIVIGEQIEIVVLEIKGDVVKIGVKAPRDVSVYRQEVFVEIQAENTRAAGSDRPSSQVSNAGALLKQALGGKPFTGAPGAGFGRPSAAKVRPETPGTESGKPEIGKPESGKSEIGPGQGPV